MQENELERGPLRDREFDFLQTIELGILNTKMSCAQPRQSIRPDRLFFRLGANTEKNTTCKYWAEHSSYPRLGECFTASEETDLLLTLGGTVGSEDGNPKLIKRATTEEPKGSYQLTGGVERTTMLINEMTSKAYQTKSKLFIRLEDPPKRYR